MSARAAIYLRISLDRTGEGLAVERQREACMQIIRQRGWAVAGEYVDNSVSASDARKSRPAYDRLVAAWERGEYDALVCWDLDRLTRQPRQLEDWIDRATERGLRLVTANGEADLGTDGGRMYARIKASVARGEVERKSARQKAAHAQRAAAGKPWTTRRPFGFEADGMTHRPEEASVVRGMYDDILAGTSQNAIAAGLNSSGVRTSLGNEWTQGTVRALLRNPRNAGIRARNGEVIGKAAWDPIVSEAVWRLALAATTGSSKGGGARKHLLIGAAECGVCDQPIRTAYTARGVRLYSCPDGHVGRKAESVEDHVAAVIVGLLTREEGIAQLLDGGRTEAAAAAAAEADTIRRRLDQVAEDYAEGLLSRSQLLKASERLRQLLAETEARMSALASRGALAPILTAEDPAAAWLLAGTDRQRALIRALLEVKIHPTGRGSRYDYTTTSITLRDDGRDVASER
ncbi:recombinase family protein [Sinomonas sp. JGH33]|uniref:Recombinase family protein n=1 Tax=Sinomonas terricola TaxID=3110330 RepID=A0ABU5T4A8_9MICC|nr:recombinase family protein [Sinomonas sp. JGH33]MEA5454503.1 recombinase family protein [Sinomonas sp. JGH33]